MELWELYAYAEGYEDQRDTELNVLAWRTGKYTGAAFNGKLQNLGTYLNKSNKEKKAAPKISKVDFDTKLKVLQGGG